MKHKIAICMATYNGEKYIDQQIKSILNQSYSDFDLYIRDDGSTDKTVSIINKYLLDSRVILLNDSLGNMGYKNNFNEIMKHLTEYDYIFFSDQDDLWNKEKMQVIIDFINLKKLNPYVEKILIYSNYSCIDENNNFLFNAYSQEMEIDFFRSFVQNEILGCTMVISNALLNIALDIPKSSVSHDDWIALLALLDGKVMYLNQILISHRIHNNNATTNNNTTSFSNRLYRVFKRFKNNNEYIRNKKNLYMNLVKRVGNKNKDLNKCGEILFDNRFRAFIKTVGYNFNGTNRIQTFLFRLQILLK